MLRSKYPKQKVIAFVSDWPAHAEITTDTAFTAPSHRAFLSGISAISQKVCEDTQAFPFTYLDGFTSYLKLVRPEDDDRNMQKSIVTRKQVPVGEGFVEVPWLKDVWVSPGLWSDLQALVLELTKVQPKLVVITGKWAFLLLSGCPTLVQTRGAAGAVSPQGGLTKWRGSTLLPPPAVGLHPCILLPTLNPLFMYDMKEKTALGQADSRRIAETLYYFQQGVSFEDLLPFPDSVFLVGTEFETALAACQKLLHHLDTAPVLTAVDIETKAHCLEMIGFAYEVEATPQVFTIPFIDHENRKSSLWTREQEVALTQAICHILCHPNIRLVGQNYAYDAAWIARDWHVHTPITHDTMLLQHTLYNKLPKDLGTLASLYAPRYSYWKEGLYDAFQQRCIYNGRDCLYTLQVCQSQLAILEKESPALQAFYAFQVKTMTNLLFDVTQRGVRVDNRRKESLKMQLKALCGHCEDQLARVMKPFTTLACPSDPFRRINWKSTKEVRLVLKDFLGIVPNKNRKTGGESFAYDDMLEYAEQYPQYKPLLMLILEYKSLLVFTNTFLSMTFDADGRFHTGYNIAGTSTARLSSRKNPFGHAGNLQNVSTGDTIKLAYSIEGFGEEEDTDELDGAAGFKGITKLPNCKQLLLPDPGYIIADIDLSAVDLYGVVYDSGCHFLAKELAEGRDVYSTLASEYYQRTISKKDRERQVFKSISHGSNYGGHAPTLAHQANLDVRAVKKVQDFYFRLAPEIKLWHKRQGELVKKHGYIETVWGNRGWFLNVDDKTWLNQLLAFLPQSTAAGLINRIWAKVSQAEPTVQFLAQVHDSLVFQYPASDPGAFQRVLAIANSIPVPYGSWDKKHIIRQDFIIPMAGKTSATSYGDCK